MNPKEILEEIIKEGKSNFPDFNIELIEKAYQYASRIHESQLRKSGEPYISHPLEVARILVDWKTDDITIAASLLHDVIEDSGIPPEELYKDLKKKFSKEIANIIQSLSKLDKDTFSSAIERQVENFRRMIPAMLKDLRVVLIKLADRTHNVRTLSYLPEDKQISICIETRDIYIPLASRIGMDVLKSELEDITFKVIERDMYEEIEKKFKHFRKQNKAFMERSCTLIEKRIKAIGIDAEISSRIKNYYSTYQKMLRQNVTFEEIYDLMGIRITLNSLKDCYAALGEVHSIWKPVPTKFKDYIAIPKMNMYQSIHTSVITDEGLPLEVQIRTRQMHRIAEYGIAAHWFYKEKAISSEDEKFVWLQDLDNLQKGVADPHELLSYIKTNLLPDEIWVFTPKGDIKTFPKGSTVIDFAYSIHTELGHTFVGAKVNGVNSSYNHELQPGDRVTILSDSNKTPNWNWLKVVKTSKAKDSIKQWLKKHENEMAIKLGREISQQELLKHNIIPDKFFKSNGFQEFLKNVGYNNLDDFTAAVGHSKVNIIKFLEKHPYLLDDENLFRKTSMLKKVWTLGIEKRKTLAPVVISEEDGNVTHFARCCNPIPGDNIVGFRTANRGISIHKRDCENLLAIAGENLLDLAWNSRDNRMYKAKIQIETTRRIGLLAEICTAVSKEKASIISAKVKEKHETIIESKFVIEVKNLKNLNKVLTSIRLIDGIVSVSRI
ncbi:bifunctional (p)ppGpp synthetase/guanosine-3',5'-bis(diphosphate) 3'-pyrophosphohydrolase [bacterium]|nr:bifunctional (p)ppGpp synthetase/guanosine-3',5'-bis(diphosphate) 3'-pyrophosphohydrolase [bacterium]